jgi:hypothetical protein
MNIYQRNIIVSHILSTIAFLKENKNDFSEYIELYQRKFEEKGYYDVFRQNPYQYILDTHLEGRRALYLKVELFEEKDYTLIKSTPDQDFYNNPSFIFLEVEIDEFRKFSKTMAENNAKKLGVRIEIEYRNDIEYAYIFKEGL